MATIKSEAVEGLRTQIDAAVQEVDGIPGLQYYAVNKNGEYIFEHVAGKTGLGKQEDMTSQHAMWMASCTKMITSIACMQLVEQGKLALDDVSLVEKIAPELKDIKVLQPDGTLVEKKQGITLRMLLTHTAGFSYSFFNYEINAWRGPAGFDELSGLSDDYLKQPLVNQPGEKFAYGINLDWVGELVMRVSGLSLGEYFKKHIFEPLGIEKDIMILPDEQIRRDMAWFHFRNPEGKLKLRDAGQMFRVPLVAPPEQLSNIFHSGGAGTFARPRAYCQIIAMLLNDGVHAPSGNRLLNKDTIDQMFTNQIADMPDFARQKNVVSKAEYANEAPEFYPEPGNPPQGWGLSFFLHLQDSMVHSKGTGWWCGLPNLFWWCDRSRGLGGILATQIVPFGDLKVITLWATIEGGIVANLVSS